MTYQLRDYQSRASAAAVNAFKSKTKKNSVLVLPTGAGKSLVIADIASKIESPLIVLQPSKEILKQNFAKIQSYGIFDCAVYSASLNRKDINRITFATIGSVIKHMDFFKHFKYVIVDECHLVNSNGGMYKTFFEDVQRKIVGLTATPYRLSTSGGGAMLKFITRTRPKIFSDVIYHCQVSELLAKGFLARLNYYDLTRIDLTRVRSNSTGADYDEKSLSAEFARVDIYNYIINTVKRLLRPKSGIPRKGILIFTMFTREAQMIASVIPGSAFVSGETPATERDRILGDFKSGKIKVLANVGVLTTGFDYPELDTVVLVRPTKSLSLYYQMVGRVIRPAPGKEGWLIDLCGNYRRFGKVEDLRVEQPEKGKWCVMSRGRQLTNVYF
mgnify:FL=1